MFMLFIVIVMIAAVLLIPTPIYPGAGIGAAAGLDDFSFPTADSSRSIPELYGTLWIYGNLIYYGNLRSSVAEMCS